MKRKKSKKLDPIPVRLDPEVRAELDQIIADEEIRSLSGYINWVLKQHLAERRKKQTKE